MNENNDKSKSAGEAFGDLMSSLASLSLDVVEQVKVKTRELAEKAPTTAIDIIIGTIDSGIQSSMATGNKDHFMALNEAKYHLQQASAKLVMASQYADRNKKNIPVQ